MNARQIEDLLGEWRQLTEAERQAITAEDWAALQTRQERKQRLQTQIMAASGERADLARQFHPAITELIALERSNAQLLAGRRETVRQQLTELDRSAGNLRGLNRAYGSAAGAKWTSYS